jgi:hypothetical protein
MMAGLAARLSRRRWLRAPRPTARLRLTLLYSALFLASGAVLLAATYLLVEKANGNRRHHPGRHQDPLQ